MDGTEDSGSQGSQDNLEGDDDRPVFPGGAGGAPEAGDPESPSSQDGPGTEDTEGLKPQEDSGPGGPTSASSGLRSRGVTSHGPPKTAGADSIESVSSTSSNYDGGDNAALYNKGQKSSKSARKSAKSEMSAGGQIPVSEPTPPTKLSTKICIGITLLLGLTVIIILVWLIKSKCSWITGAL